MLVKEELYNHLLDKNKNTSDSQKYAIKEYINYHILEREYVISNDISLYDVVCYYDQNNNPIFSVCLNKREGEEFDLYFINNDDEVEFIRYFYE